MSQPSATRPSSTAGVARPAAAPSRFGGSFGSMLMGGLIGAGLFGLLSGHGLFGGMAGLASIIGLLLQVALIGGAIWLALAFFRSRQQPAMAGSGPGGLNAGRTNNPNNMMRQAAYTPGGAGGNAGPDAKLAIVKDDFDAFERLLTQMQDAYGAENTRVLERITTPEMLSYLSADLAENARKGVRNVVSNAKLLQGDLSEAWREQGAEYASVAMRFELLDTMVDRNSGRVVSGNPTVPQEATEIWTFQRRPGSGAPGWQLSGIQQVE